MNPDIQKLLRELDDPERWEFPVEYDRVDVDRRFQAFTVDLERRLGFELRKETGAYIQDASFFAQIFFPNGALRFSNFGSLIAFTPDNEVPESTVTVVCDAASAHGYVVVPTATLETRYTGKNPGVTGIETWWIRYFDYV